jgi:uncharacterized membrane protein
MVVAALLQAAALALILSLYFLGVADAERLITGFASFVFGTIFLYFFYRMIRPTMRVQGKEKGIMTNEEWEQKIKSKLDASAKTAQSFREIE